MLMINGKSAEEAGMTLSDYLEKNGYRSDCVAVEINENILPRGSYDQVVLKDNDHVEIVQFVGGG